MTLKEKFNRLTAERIKAEKFLDSDTYPIELQERYIPEYRKLLKKMDEILAEMTAQGIKWTDDEALNGFEVIGKELSCRLADDENLEGFQGVS